MAMTGINWGEAAQRAIRRDWDWLLANLPVLPRRISTQMYLGIGGALMMTLLAGSVAWISFEVVGRFQTRITENAVPELTAAFDLARSSGNLVAVGPRLTAADSEGQFTLAAFEAAAVRAELDAALAGFGGQGEDVARIRELSAEISEDIARLESDQRQILELNSRAALISGQIAVLRDELAGMLGPAIDDQLFFLATGIRDDPALSAGPDAQIGEHVTAEELNVYRRLTDLQADSNIAVQVLASAFILDQAAAVEPLRERFEAAAERIQLGLAGLAGHPIQGLLAPVFSQLQGLALAESGGFDTVENTLRLTQQQDETMVRSQTNAGLLGLHVDYLVRAASGDAASASADASNSIQTGRLLLLAITALAVAGGVFIAWLYVGRVITARIDQLAVWMRRLANGDLEAREVVAGNDEIAELGEALEVFRRHALEVQRLNLVEELAQQLQENNEELAAAVAQLQRAQGQIVAQENLAALGELTAAVAHEIRNPLNFIKNFSEASAELIEELGDITDPETGEVDEEGQEILLEVANDLEENLERIRNHCQRAEHIVTNMLRMGRGSGELQPTDINHLITLHAKLAFQGARSKDPDLQADLAYELDPEIGQLMVIPQDMGRVILNLVANACYAVDERWRGSLAGPQNSDDAGPRIKLSSERNPENVEIRVRDNGPGIPEDVVDKIFNPFFTTKPTDQGTGLGLSISNDIVVGRGGTMSVESEPGQFTEFTIRIPLDPPRASAPEAVEAGSPG